MACIVCNWVSAKLAAGVLGVINLLLYLILIGFSTWAFENVAGDLMLGKDLSRLMLILVSLLTGVVGTLSAVSSLYYVKYPAAVSHASASATAIISAAFSLVALGFASKNVNLGSDNSKFRVLEAFSIIVGITQLGFTVLMHYVDEVPVAPPVVAKLAASQEAPEVVQIATETV
ncbi:hypothetical protein SELMODRAFT_427082 [Selaginella moellendorffii]|uniref:Uncharacterized protein n=1 Tax=Selaginella moellendorffii TaxID=88036 RepID=D8SYG4_SELML|nr:hypothetical protein SELMODRAFT_427082 [Selaginella moellendorffii]